MGWKVKGTGIFPKFSDTPGEIWRGAVFIGHDNDLVFSQLLGMGESEITGLAETKCITERKKSLWQSTKMFWYTSG